MIKERHKEFLRHLTIYPTFKKVNFYADLLGVSNKTIYRDIDYLNSFYFCDNVIMLIRGQGVTLNVTTDVYYRILAKVNEEKESQSSIYSNPNIRQKAILFYLLYNNEVYLSQNAIAKIFFVSKTLVNEDIQKIRNSLIDDNLSIITNRQGTKIVGDITTIRNLFLKVIFDLTDYIGINESEISLQNLLSYVLFDSLSISYPEKFAELIARLIYLIDSLVMNELTFYEKRKLFYQIFILISTSRKNNTESNNYFNNINIDSALLPIATYLFNEINDFQLICHSEIEYLQSMLMEINSLKRIILNVDSTISAINVTGFINDFVDALSIVTEIDLYSKEGFMNRIEQHITDMIMRVLSNNQIGNDILKLVKTEYQNTLDLCYIICKILELKFKIPPISLDEIGFLAIYLQSEISSFTHDRKVLVLFEEDKLFKEFVRLQLKAYFPEWHIDFEKVNNNIIEKGLNDYFIYINMTDTKFKSEYVPTIKINRFINHSDIKSLKEFYKNVDKNINNPIKELQRLIISLYDFDVKINVSFDSRAEEFIGESSGIVFEGKGIDYIFTKNSVNGQEFNVYILDDLIRRIEFKMENIDYLLYCVKIPYLIEENYHLMKDDFLFWIKKEEFEFV